MAQARKRKLISRRLGFEQLEGRDLLTAFNVPWPEAKSLTLSFTPDGTAIGSQQSQLFQTLDANATSSAWQEAVLRAFQTWAVETNVNIGLVADGGQPLGSLGLKQGDLRFGDIRIGAFPMASDVLAVADPYDPFVANTWVGDVFLNSAVQFSTAGQSPGYDVFSVLLHEAGHVLGIGHSPDPNSPMFEQFHNTAGVDAALTDADISALQALYGMRSPDAADAVASNDSLATATPLSLSDPNEADLYSAVEADISTLADADVYRVVVPAGVESLNINLQASGVSLLVPRMTILDAAGQPISSSTAADPLHNDLALQLTQVKAGETYYVKVESGRHDVFGIGSYRLDVKPNSTNSETTPFVQGASDKAATAVPVDQLLADAQLLSTTPGYVEHTYYEEDGSLDSASPVKTYRVRSADIGPNMTNVMTVVVASSHDTNVQARVLDDQGQPVGMNVITSAAGQLEIQIPSVRSNVDYIVEVFSNDLGTRKAEYELEVDFDQDAKHLQTFVNDSLSNNKPEVAQTLEVVQSQQFHFVLSATDWNNPAATGVAMTIADASGHMVYTMNVEDGATRSGDVFLNQGQYTVRFTSVARQANSLVSFQLSGITTSDALGPQLHDTTLAPVDVSAEAALTQLSFYWLPLRPADRLSNLIAPSLLSLSDDTSAAPIISSMASLSSVIPANTGSAGSNPISGNILNPANLAVDSRRATAAANDDNISSSYSGAIRNTSSTQSTSSTRKPTTTSQWDASPSILFRHKEVDSQTTDSRVSDTSLQAGGSGLAAGRSPNSANTTDSSAVRETDPDILVLITSRETDTPNAEQMPLAADFRMAPWIFGAFAIALGRMIRPINRNEYVAKLCHTIGSWRSFIPRGTSNGRNSSSPTAE